MAEYSFSSKSNLIEHQNQSQPVYNNTSSSSNNNSTKKRFEKLKLKLIELFFPSAPNAHIITHSRKPTRATPTAESASNSNAVYSSKRNSISSSKSNRSSRKNSAQLIEPLNNTISNYYYGYKSHILDSNNEFDVDAQSSLNSTMQDKSNSKRQVKLTKSDSFEPVDLIRSPSRCSIKTSATSSLSANLDSNSISNLNFFIDGAKICDPTYLLNTQRSLNSTVEHGLENDKNTHENTNSNTLTNTNTNKINRQNEINPFLDNKLTDLITFNTSFNLLNTYFESSLPTIDDEDNFFDINFMTNYISYILLTKLNESTYLNEQRIHLKLVQSQDDKLVANKGTSVTSLTSQCSSSDAAAISSQGLLKKISRDIFKQSESEPCGLKGCKMSIFLESNVNQNINDNDYSSKTESHLITQFRFDSTCSLTTFQLNLVLKQEQAKTSASDKYSQSFNMQNTGLQSQNESSLVASFSTSTLKRLFSRNKSSPISNVKTTSERQDQGLNFIHLDELNYDIYKCKLY